MDSINDADSGCICEKAFQNVFVFQTNIPAFHRYFFVLKNCSAAAWFGFSLKLLTLTCSCKIVILMFLIFQFYELSITIITSGWVAVQARSKYYVAN